MRGVSARKGGGAVAGVGVLLSLFHLEKVLAIPSTPPELAIELFPLVLSVSMTVVGAAMARGRFAGRQFVERMLAWMGVGAVALSILGGWTVAGAVLRGFPLPWAFVPILNAATAGALIGLLVGVYDARSQEHQQSLEEANRINDTLRIATQELVGNSERGALEQAVCDRLTESDPYDAAWVGRYEEGDSHVRPAAWAGFEDAYFDSLEITVNDDPSGQGAGGRAIKTGEIQCIPDVFADPTMEPWWEQFEARGVESLAVVPISDDDSVYGFVSIYADRQNVFDEREREVLSELGETIGHAVASIETHERLAERERELERQNERLEEFAGVVSHDLRNPLNVAEGFLELAREEGDEQHFARVEDALGRMDELIEDLLTLARQGAAVDAFDDVPLADVVEAAWETAGSSAATLRIADELGTVACDQSRLRELLENLFGNSVEHGSTSSRPGADDSVEHAGPEVTVTVRRTDAGFAVEDDGPGIPADERETVFEAGHSTNAEGTGFGLNIVRSVAEAHGWSVSLGESPDGGVRFEFSGVETVESEPVAR
ncbi:ATP-binding protein [Halopelagius longus]|uniref:histidine kinase n=1 Tax=Halopelagius longus TaxID=1236180 RepID=A0A1H0Y6V0_9EURY|nr:ATP-binding protein [Halopelagius longus]RDI72308.1 GAF domain-containing protein [Halopelagius longus]SDQ10810.1 Signal transduction histidine kinase [Halopelagius longus]